MSAGLLCAHGAELIGFGRSSSPLEVHNQIDVFEQIAPSFKPTGRPGSALVGVPSIAAVTARAHFDRPRGGPPVRETGSRSQYFSARRLGARNTASLAPCCHN